MASPWSPLRRVLYFLCGAVVGFLVGLETVVRICFGQEWPTWVMILLFAACALSGGILSARLGDSFPFWQGAERWRWFDRSRRRL